MDLQTFMEDYDANGDGQLSVSELELFMDRKMYDPFYVPLVENVDGRR
jgi:hypothetical protein